jgi:hypothetical protein
LETVEALGVCLWYHDGSPFIPDWLVYESSEPGNGPQPNLEQIVDGCCDIKVVTTGTLIACGVPDILFQDMVDENNLEKAKNWTIREDGKFIKHPDHKPPDIAGGLARLGFRKENVNGCLVCGAGPYQECKPECSVGQHMKNPKPDDALDGWAMARNIACWLCPSEQKRALAQVDAMEKRYNEGQRAALPKSYATDTELCE